jgi:hypothetical protein
MIQIIEKHLTTPNNVLGEVKKELQKYGFQVPGGIKGKIYVKDKLYSLTTTSYKLDYPDARQYDSSLEGLVTLWLKDGNFYIFEKELLNAGVITREFKGDISTQVRSKVNFGNSYLLDGMRILDKQDYKDLISNAIESVKSSYEIEKYV